jgi:hypothetical protein
MRMFGSVALGAGYIGLVSIPTSIQAAWKTESLDDAPMVAQASSKRGFSRQRIGRTVQSSA